MDMQTFIRLLAALLAGFLLYVGIEDSTTTPGVMPDPNNPTFESLTVINSVEARVLESFPVQVHLNVTGYQPDGCDYPVNVRQAQNGSTISVTIYRDLPLAAACPMMIVDYQATIPLEGEFVQGTSYTIDVNGTVVTVTI